MGPCAVEVEVQALQPVCRWHALQGQQAHDADSMAIGILLRLRHYCGATAGEVAGDLHGGGGTSDLPDCRARHLQRTRCAGDLLDLGSTRGVFCPDSLAGACPPVCAANARATALLEEGLVRGAPERVLVHERVGKLDASVRVV